MSTPDKTSETLNLAEQMNANIYQSDSDENAVGGGKPTDDALNANLSESMTHRLKDTDMSFRQTVVTTDSSSDFIVDGEDGAETEQYENVLQEDGINQNLGIDQNNGDEHDSSLTVIKPDSEHQWKPKVGKVYNRVLAIQKSCPKKYNSTSFSKHETVVEENVEDAAIEIKSELVSCTKCGRKVAAGAINRHMQFCIPSDSDVPH